MPRGSRSPADHLRRALWPLALAAGLGALAITLTSDHTARPESHAIATLLLGWAFIASGLIAWTSRQLARFAPLMVVEGFAWLAVSLQDANASIVYTIGVLVANVPFAMLAHLLLAFPEGRLGSPFARATVAAVWVDVTVLQLVWLFFFDPTAGTCTRCPDNAFMLHGSESAADAISSVAQLVGVVAVAATITLFAARWRAASPPARRTLGPVIWSGGFAAGLLAVALIARVLSSGAADVIYLLALIALISVPLAFIAGLILARFARLAVVRLVIELVQSQAPGRLRDALARTLRDPSLTLAYWIPETESYVDSGGRPVELPDAGSGRTVTVVERDGRRIGALVHDASLRDNPELLDAVSAAAGLALENERLQAELRARLVELSESEGRLRALIEAAPLAIVEVGLDRNVTFWNVAAETLFGWTAEEAVGHPVPFTPEGQDDSFAHLREKLGRGESYADVEAVRKRKDGSPVAVSISAAPIRGVDGRIVRFMAAIVDITERKRAQEELSKERDFISAVIDTAATLVIVTDREGRFIRFNKECERVTGYTFDEVEGRPYWDIFIDPGEAERIRAAVGKVWAGDFPSHNENAWILRDGSRRVIAWSNTALLDDEGNVEYMVSSGLDVTERKRAEVEIRASRARIVEAGDAERRRLERNLHDGAQQRLVALSLALRMAKGQVRSSPDSAEQLLDASAEELAHALTELRELARGIHPAVLTDRGLEAALETLAARAPAPVDVRVELDARLPAPVEAAAYYVVSEALANVAKYAQASAIAVSVERADGYALVEVADDGIGGADASQGSGLRGLADRVEALDGMLEVVSSRGEGTRIRARIPLGG
jgi:PAS domain S-box-containing protein